MNIHKKGAHLGLIMALLLAGLGLAGCGVNPASQAVINAAAAAPANAFSPEPQRSCGANGCGHYPTANNRPGPRVPQAKGTAYFQQPENPLQAVVEEARTGRPGTSNPQERSVQAVSNLLIGKQLADAGCTPANLVGKPTWIPLSDAAQDWETMTGNVIDGEDRGHPGMVRYTCQPEKQPLRRVYINPDLTEQIMTEHRAPELEPYVPPEATAPSSYTVNLFGN